MRPSEKRKRDGARALLSNIDFGTSAQVLGRIPRSATQKIAEPLSEAHALQFIARLVRPPIVAVDSDLVMDAIALKHEHRVSYWGGAIIAAAHRLKAKIIYSEDLTHEQVYA